MLNQNLKYWVALKWVEGVRQRGLLRHCWRLSVLPQKVFGGTVVDDQGCPGLSAIKRSADQS